MRRYPASLPFTPSSGPVGTMSTLTGTSFTGATSVGFNGAATTDFSVNSDTQITVTVPSGATSGPITVTTPGGTATSDMGFIVIAMSPSTTTVTSDNNPSTYGQNVTLTAAVSPATATGTVQFFDGATSLGSATLSGGTCSISTSALLADTHSITADYSGDSGDTTSISAALSQVVNKAPLIISAVPDSKTYDGSTSSAEIPYVVSGLQGSDTVTGLAQTFSSADAMGNGGSTLQVTAYTINDGFGDNYAVTLQPASGTINQATLTVTPDAKTVTYGDPVPTYTYEVTGFVNSENAKTAAGYTAPSCSSAYTPTTSVSASPLTITASGGVATNYVFNTSATANLTINQATLTVTPDAKTVTYGDPVPTYTYEVTGFVNSENAKTAAGYTAPSCSSAYTPTTSVSASPLTITASGGVATNYVFNTSATANLTINQATLSVTPDNASRNYGDPDPTPGFTVSGFVGSDTWTTAPTGAIAKPDRNVGHYAITFSGGNAGGNYTVSYWQAH